MEKADVKCLKEQFKNPGADKRSIPFWSWNGRLEEAEIRNQIRQMKQAGAGGFFMHSRIGLETEYMGQEWMDCVKAAVEEAEKQGLYAWIYDEDRWPSGTAGGQVTAGGDAYRCKGLTLEICDAGAYPRLYEQEIRLKKPCRDDRLGVLAAYKAVIEGERILHFRRLALREEETFGKEEVLLVVRLEVSAPSEWFNQQTPPDNLNPDCVKRFIELTHERYKEVIGDAFGKTVAGVFTDEPSLNDRFAYFGEHKSWIPWTFGYGEYFQEKAGYDFLDVCPLFYFHGTNSAKIRHDYWCSIAQRYGESYFKTLGQWCEENGLCFTGHFLQEDKLGLCTRVNGAVMPNYQYMHIPGIDMLCEQTGEFMTVKQCTSVANQLGKKRVITETYGCTGWEFTFEGQKWIGDWQYVLGVNRRCQHLMLYSLRGCRKRDYPPSFNYNTNWWREHKIVDDYFARLSVVLERGEAVRTILLMHPASTAWAGMGVDPYGNPKRREERDVPALNAYGNRFNSLIEYLLREHLDLDLGDELLIRQYGQACEGKFRVGKAVYQAVVLPPMDTLLLDTCEKLLAYMEQGGRVYAMTPNPYMIGGEQAHPELYQRLITHENWITVDSREELAERLAPYRSIRIEEKAGQECREVLYQLRREGTDHYLFLVNNSRSRALDVTVTLPFSALPARMELLSGDILEGTELSGGRLGTDKDTSKPAADYENDAEGLKVKVHLDRTGSALFWLKGRQKEVRVYEGPFAIALDHDNVLPLDLCRYRVGQEDWSKEQEVWSAQKQLRERLGMRPVYHNGIEQRYKWIGKPHPQDGCPVELLFSFVSGQRFEGLGLALERPEDFRVFLNGEELCGEPEGWFLDKEIPILRLPIVKPGENLLSLCCAYRNDMELENIYLVGPFGVAADRKLTVLPERLAVGSWTEQGLKHYCGSVTYRMEYDLEEEACSADGRSGKIWLRLPPMQAVCVKLRIHGAEQLLPWNFDRDISIEDRLRPGKNRIEVEVIGSPRNAMGPFHVKEKPYNTNDESFRPTGDAFSKAYLLVPYGIMDSIKIIKEF